MTRRHTPRLRPPGSLRLAAAVAAAVSVFLVGGCGGEAGDTVGDRVSDTAPENAAGTETSSTSIAPTKHYSVRQLAAVVGCTARPQGNAVGLRRASCAQGDVAILGFDTADGQKAWLDGTVRDGGIYLVGDRWVLSGTSREHLLTLRGTLGGTIQVVDPSS